MRSRALGHNERVRDQFASTARDGSAPTEGGSRFGADPSSVGYVRTEDEGIEKTPDRQVQEAIAGIFRKFRELGSVRQVLPWYRDEKLLIPTLSRAPGHRKIVWSVPVYPRIFGLLKNPTYAGFFVWGRKHARTSIVDGRARKTRGHARPPEQWEVTIPNHRGGYITWEEFMRNQHQIRANAGWNARMGSANGAVRNGPASLAGLLRCGRCGRALQVAYTRSKQHGSLPRYWCAGDRGQQMVRTCTTFAGTRVDQFVAIEVLEALRPLGVQAAIEALITVRTRSMRSSVHWSSLFRRRAMKPAASNGSIRQRNRRTVWLLPNWKSDGTTL
jgi:hypothetical protein